MDRRTFLAGAAALLAAPLAAEAQPAGKVQQSGQLRRVGFLALGSRPPTPDPVVEAIDQGLRDYGYVEGQNLIVERRWAYGDRGRLPSLAAELVRSRVEVILVAGPPPIEAVRQATTTIPIVMAAGSADPVAEGLAASIARPGGNITGVTYAVSPERFGKQLELLKSASIRLSRVAVLWDLDLDLFRRVWATPLREAAQALALQVQEPIQVHDEQQLPQAFATMQESRADAVLVATGGPLYGARALVGTLAVKHRLPTMAAFKEFPNAGGLMSYGPDLPDLYRKAAGYVGKILNGARPGDLPIEQPTKYELVINLKTAKALGLTIPPLLLARADQVIE
jgi:putative ABC transport system substrate-binding protein